MSATVRPARGVVVHADISDGVAVRARTWRTAADTLNWCGGVGECLVPAYCPELNLAVSTTATFVFRANPTGRAVRRVWMLTVSGVGTIVVTPGAAAAVTIASSGSRTYATVNEDLAAKASSVGNLLLTVANGSGGSGVYIYSISCYEQTRAELDLNTADYGIDTLTTSIRRPIDSRQYESLGGIAEALALAPQRRHYMNVARDYTTTGAWSDAVGVYKTMMNEMPILTRKLYPSSVTGAVRFYFLCSASNATTDGDILITNDKTTNTAALAVTNPGTTPAWYTVDVAADYECTDFSGASGMPGGTFSTFSITFRQAGAAGTFYVYSAAAIEY